MQAEGLAGFVGAKDEAGVEAVRIDFLGLKQGRLKAAQEVMKGLGKADKPVYGQRFNAVEADALEAVWESSQGAGRPPGREVADAIDVTLPGSRPRIGHRHPLTQTDRGADRPVRPVRLHRRPERAGGRGRPAQLRGVEHPEPVHPARDPADNFYIGEGTMLRSQTSTVQIRTMESQPPPVRVIAIGRVFRPDTRRRDAFADVPPDRRADGGPGVTMADLKTVLRLFASSYLGRDVKIRFRPSFFPFTEPSVEVDMLWHGGDRWVEMEGAGMVDPNVFKAVGYDPDEVSGFAFGLGIERLCMRRHGIKDIRSFYQNDVRFLGQF